MIRTQNGEIERLMAAQPELTPHGFGVYNDSQLTREARDRELEVQRHGMLGEDFRLQVALCREVIARLPTRKSVDPKGPSSYSWKHIVERKLRQEGRPHYVSNGAFIAAALLQGLEVERLPRGPNARFNISRRYRRILGTRC